MFSKVETADLNNRRIANIIYESNPFICCAAVMYPRLEQSLFGDQL